MSTAKVVGIFVVVVIFVWLVAVGIWGLGVATAGIYGKGEAHKQIQSAEFRLSAYQTFFNQCASVQGLEGQIDTLNETLVAYETGSREYNLTLTSLAGVKGARHQAIAKYNQDALKDYTEGQFRDRDLPYHIADTNYPAEGGKTVCAVR